MPALFLLIFVVLLTCIGMAIWLGSGFLNSAEKSRLVGRLRTPSTSVRMASSPVFIEDRRDSPASMPSLIDRVIRELGTRAASAGTDWTGGGVLASCTGLMVIGAIVGWIFPLLILRWLTSVVLAVTFGLIPLRVISTKRSNRMKQFAEQFPEALDFIARAIRAGHAFSVSLEMLAAESPDPSRGEWQRVFREHNLGSPLENALLGMAERVPLIDVKFFVSAVILQREAGGNLSEILTNLAGTVRERFRLKGHIQAATAHARITSLILTALPIIVLIGLQIRSPGYLKVFWNTTDGQLLLLGAFLGQILGYLLMRKVIDIRV